MRGDLARREGRLADAERELRAGLDLDQRASPLQLTLGAVFEAQGRTLEARRTYARALELGVRTEDRDWVVRAVAKLGIRLAARPVARAATDRASNAEAASDGTPATPAFVGALGASERIRVRHVDARNVPARGAATFTPEAIVRALVRDYSFLIAAHPRATLASFLAWIEERIGAGYRRAGFPRAEVTAEYDRAADAIAVIRELVEADETCHPGRSSR